MVPTTTAMVWPIMASFAALMNSVPVLKDALLKCVYLATRPCGIDVGECAQGTETCRNNAWSTCEGAIEPTDEVCGDGLDNDCNGTADDACDDVRNVLSLTVTDETAQWADVALRFEQNGHVDVAARDAVRPTSAQLVLNLNGVALDEERIVTGAAAANHEPSVFPVGANAIRLLFSNLQGIQLGTGVWVTMRFHKVDGGNRSVSFQEDFVFVAGPTQLNEAQAALCGEVDGECIGAGDAAVLQ